MLINCFPTLECKFQEGRDVTFCCCCCCYDSIPSVYSRGQSRCSINICRVNERMLVSSSCVTLGQSLNHSNMYQDSHVNKESWGLECFSGSFSIKLNLFYKKVRILDDQEGRIHQESLPHADCGRIQQAKRLAQGHIPTKYLLVEAIVN